MSECVCFIVEGLFDNMFLFNSVETIFDASLRPVSRIFFTKIWIPPQNRDGLWEGGVWEVSDLSLDSCLPID